MTLGILGYVRQAWYVDLERPNMREYLARRKAENKTNNLVPHCPQYEPTNLVENFRFCFFKLN